MGLPWVFLFPAIAAMVIGYAFVRYCPEPNGGTACASAPDAVGIHATVVNRRALAVLMVSVAAGGLIYGTSSLSLPKFVDENFPGSSATAAGFMMSAVLLLGAICQGLAGPSIRRWGLERSFMFIAPLAASLMTGVALGNGLASIVLIAALLIVVYGQVIINDVIVARYPPIQIRSRVYAVRLLIGFGAASISPVLIFIVYDFDGTLATVYSILILSSLSMIVGAVALPRDRKQPSRLATTG